MKKQPPASLIRFLTELVKQTKELCERTTRQIPAFREMAGAPSPQQARPKRDAAGEAGQEKENALPPDRGINAEQAAAKAGARPDDPPAEGGSTEQPPAGPRQVIPPGQAPPEEQAGNAVRPESSGAGRDLKNRFDAAQSRIRDNAQSEELEALLDQAVTLLESLSQHPAIRDYSANQRKLEEIEQRLGYGSYPQ
jgi:cell division septation protein DedD